jgi:hypothetical protein
MNSDQRAEIRRAWKDYKQLEEEAFGRMRQAQESAWQAYMRTETLYRETFLAELGALTEE